MLRCVARISSFVALAFAASFLVAQTEFSADIIDLQKPGSPTTAKLYVSKDKIRTESQASGPRAGGAVIMNFATQMSIVLMAQKHMYMEVPAHAQGQRLGLFSFFEAVDVENACGEWQKIGHNQGGTCHKARSETVNARNTVKYETTNVLGDGEYFWLDSKLRFPIKWQGKSNGGELRNIQEGPQPATLFEIPTGFTKMEIPGGMMQQPR